MLERTERRETRRLHRRTCRASLFLGFRAAHSVLHYLASTRMASSVPCKPSRGAGACTCIRAVTQQPSCRRKPLISLDFLNGGGIAVVGPASARRQVNSRS